jgi:hypothetical protein
MSVSNIKCNIIVIINNSLIIVARNGQWPHNIFALGVISLCAPQLCVASVVVVDAAISRASAYTHQDRPQHPEFLNCCSRYLTSVYGRQEQQQMRRKDIDLGSFSSVIL